MVKNKCIEVTLLHCTPVTGPLIAYSSSHAGCTPKMQITKVVTITNALPFSPISRSRTEMYIFNYHEYFQNIGIRLVFYICFILTLSAAHSWAVTPDKTLYSEESFVRNQAYQEREALVKSKISEEKSEEEVKDLHLQKQLLEKLKELAPPPAPTSRSNTAPQPEINWNNFQKFLDRYISNKNEKLQATEGLKISSTKQQTLYTQLIALADDSPEQELLQLQHAYQVRKAQYQMAIIANIDHILDELKNTFPQYITYLQIPKSRVNAQKKKLIEMTKDFTETKKQQNRELDRLELTVQEQESLLSSYLGQELSGVEQKRMHYTQIKLLESQVKSLIAKAHISEPEIQLLEEQETLFWLQLLNHQKYNYALKAEAEEMNHRISQLHKEINQLPSQLHEYDSQLSTLQGGNALTGPKAQNLIPTLENTIQTTGTNLSKLLMSIERLENRGTLRRQAIDLKQSSIGAIVTRARQATEDLFGKARTFFTHPLLEYNGMALSLLLIVQIVGLLFIGICINRLYSYCIQKVGVKQNWSERTIHLIQATGRYPVIFIIAMIIFSVVGINTSSLALVAGALSLGIGFGMQTIVNNLVSGVILLFDKSIRPGDFISLGNGSGTSGYRGNVIQMNTRATVLRTNDNINIIIPNADLIASKVVNWTYGDDKVRFKVPFSIAYGSNITEVKALVLEGICKLPIVLSHPTSQIWMTKHAESSLSFVAAIWVSGKHARQPARTFDKVLTQIYTILDQHHIEIPVPQMDLRFRPRGAELPHNSELPTISPVDDFHAEAIQ